MYLHALATAVPDAVFTQAQCWDIVSRSTARQKLDRRSMLILRSILMGDHGISTRHFASEDIDRIFDLESDELNAAFRRQAPALATQALTRALTSAGLEPTDLDALLVCTCTGYLCPGLSSYVSELLGLRPNVFLQDLVGLGCGAAIPTLRAASYITASQPNSVVACIAVELCSAAFYLDNDTGVLVSACLFSDGAAATIWKGSPGPSGLRCHGFQALHLPAERDKLRFEQKNGKLRNLLHPTVPDLAASAVRRLWDEKGDRPVAQVVAHTGGRDVLSALAPVFPEHSLAATASVLRGYGNMSSPSVLFVLDECLRKGQAGKAGDFWLVSFGAGFSAHSCRIGL